MDANRASNDEQNGFTAVTRDRIYRTEMAASSSPHLAGWLAPPFQCRSVQRGVPLHLPLFGSSGVRREVARHLGPTSSLFFLHQLPPHPMEPRYLLLLHPSPQRTTFYILAHSPPPHPTSIPPPSCSAFWHHHSPAPAQVSLLLSSPSPRLFLSLCNRISFQSMPQCSKLVLFLASISMCCNFGVFFYFC